jgi:hypothetical protein
MSVRIVTPGHRFPVLGPREADDRQLKTDNDDDGVAA